MSTILPLPHPSTEDNSLGTEAGGASWRCRLDAGAIRLLDVIVASILLIVTLPLILVLAVAIKVDSPGTVFYRCRRVGLGSREFGMLKFRKMYQEAAGPALTVARDSRFTRLGRFLARSKLDELPQLWNVVKGEMSLVGPRPEDPGFVELARDEYWPILSVPPGITGFSQLAYAKESDVLDRADPVSDYLGRVLPQKLGMDRVYVERRSFVMNVRVLLWTAVAVLARRDVAVHRGTGHLNIRRRPSGDPQTAEPTGGLAS